MLGDEPRSPGPFRRVGKTFGRYPIHGCPVEVVALQPSPHPGGQELDVLQAFLISSAVIFVAELGDKSQLMAMAFATRYRPIPILIGITIATAVVHAFSVFVGAFIGARLPTTAITLIAGVLFLGFAAWTLRGDTLDEDQEARVDRTNNSVIVAASVAFFLAELGDKTMLATITLATKEGAFGTWLGSTVGMVAADALAIGVGALLGARLPEKTIRIGASIAFLVFGLVLIAQALWL